MLTASRAGPTESLAPDSARWFERLLRPVAKSELKRGELLAARCLYMATDSRMAVNAPARSPAAAKELDRLLRLFARSGLNRTGFIAARLRRISTASPIASRAAAL